jgi:hypothetical protein
MSVCAFCARVKLAGACGGSNAPWQQGIGLMRAGVAERATHPAGGRPGGRGEIARGRLPCRRRLRVRMRSPLRAVARGA